MIGSYKTSDEIVEWGFITLLEAMGGALGWSCVVGGGRGLWLAYSRLEESALSEATYC